MSASIPLRPTDRQLLATLARHGQLQRDQLALLSGLPRTTVTDALTRLRRHGLVVEREVTGTTGRVGRPPKLLTLAAPAGLVGAIALTRSTLQAAVAGFDGTLHARRAVDPYAYDAAAGLTAPAMPLLEQSLSEISRSTGDLSCLVVGVPAPVQRSAEGAHPDTRASAGASALVAGRPASLLPATLPDEFGRQVGVPVWVENDANLGALGEGEFGAAANMANFIYIKIAHGIGAGLVLNRRLYRGANGLAGELAHIHTEVDGALCFCGGRGCLTTTFSPRRLIEWIRTVHPGVDTMDDVLALAAENDAGVWRAMRDLGRAIGRSLADFCIYMAPDGIVLDGLLGKGAEPVIEGVREMLDRFAPPMVLSQLEIRGGLLGNDAELRGAAVLARQCQFGIDTPLSARVRQKGSDDGHQGATRFTQPFIIDSGATITELGLQPTPLDEALRDTTARLRG
jgi:predicted NBD/HSP70 family sugar kinase